jgi:hypothetical protein
MISFLPRMLLFRLVGLGIFPLLWVGIVSVATLLLDLKMHLLLRFSFLQWVLFVFYVV